MHLCYWVKFRRTRAVTPEIIQWSLYSLISSEPGLSVKWHQKSLILLLPPTIRLASFCKVNLSAQPRLLVSLSRAAMPCPDKTLCKAWKMLKCIPKNWRIIKGSLYCKGWSIILKLYRDFSSGFKNHNDIKWNHGTITFGSARNNVNDQTNIKWLGHLAQSLPWYGRRKVE